MINIERIMQTEIPDIAPVYGGIRGRTMSSRHQAYAWPALKEAGVKTIIEISRIFLLFRTTLEHSSVQRWS